MLQTVDSDFYFFQMFQDIHLDYTSIHMFTSLTSTKEMHEHICWFALDKNSNLILLSFHRNWGPSGYGIISDDQTLRNLNRSVLKRAPCTVGILVHRKPIWQPKSVESPCRVRNFACKHPTINNNVTLISFCNKIVTQTHAGVLGFRGRER